jgi:S-adenosyl-L-methionine hydrolase (adenosine-forming)
VTHRLPRPIGFLTDFGLRDAFVGICHGVIAATEPTVRVIDLCHEVRRGDIHRGAALLAQAAPVLPPAVLLAVVDPGVGTARRAVVLTAGAFTLVGPDNGLLTTAADALGGVDAAYEITEPRLTRAERSATFHGRDVFAPVAAHLAAGVPAAEVGPALAADSLVRLPAPSARRVPGGVAGEVYTIDDYGNTQLAVTAALAAEAGLRPGTRLTVRTPRRAVTAVVARAYGDAEPGALLCLVDSSGLLALAVNQGDAMALLGLAVGDEVVLTAV